MNTHPIASLSDDDLLSRVKHLAQRERQVTAALVAHLSELDRRRLYLGEGCSSMFTYCTQVLRLSENAAYRRILVARAARRFPVLLDKLADGTLNLTSIRLLAPHLTAENHHALLDEASHRSRRHVEKMVAGLHPQPPVPTVVRRLPERKPAAAHAPPSDEPFASAPPAPAQAPPAPPAPPAGADRRPVIAPLAPATYKFQFTASRETYEKLRRIQDLMRHQVPNGDPARIIDRALDLMLRHLEKTRLGAMNRPRQGVEPQPGSRRVPAEVRRAVVERDGERCSFVGRDGRRCTERGFLEFDHAEPHGMGGPTSTGNIRLLCRQHNQYEAMIFFGSRGRGP
jgi:hypothetical protein